MQIVISSRSVWPYLVSSDEGAKCNKELFTSINTLLIREFNQQCVINHVMADGAAGMLWILSSMNEKNFYLPIYRYHQCAREDLSAQSSIDVLELYDPEMSST